jgi:two-component system response regulator TtrR
MSGLELQEKLISRGINIPIIFMTANGDIPMTVRAMKSGASDFIEKPFNNQMLLDRIQESLDKEIQGWEERKQNLDAIERLSILTSREREVMALVVQGMLNKQIAAELDISIRTVESHRANIMEKLGVKSVSQLVRISLEEQ